MKSISCITVLSALQYRLLGGFGFKQGFQGSGFCGDSELKEFRI